MRSLLNDDIGTARAIIDPAVLVIFQLLGMRRRASRCKGARRQKKRETDGSEFPSHHDVLELQAWRITNSLIWFALYLLWRDPHKANPATPWNIMRSEFGKLQEVKALRADADRSCR